MQVERDTLALLGEKPSPFAVSLRYSFADAENLYCVLPLLSGGDLSFHLRHAKDPKRKFNLERARFYAAQIALGLSHMHSLGLIYRDLKLENVLLDDAGHTCISDMGLATSFTPGTKNKGRAGTPGYWPPEMIKKEGYDEGADWWGFGCCIYEMLTGHCPFSTEVTKRETRDDGTVHHEVKYERELIPADCEDLLRQLLDRNVDTRMKSLDRVSAHAFFASIDFGKLARGELPPPWKPTRGEINAEDQADIEDRNHTADYAKLKLGPEDDLPGFGFTAMHPHETDLVTVLKLKDEGQLEYLEKKDSGCCVVS